MKVFVALLALVAIASAEYGTKVGDFKNYVHGIGGEVYAKDDHTLFIKDFEYDGAGPDAFFWVGTSGSPSSVGTILPYPFEGKFYEYEDQSAPILNGRFDKVDITLTLPEDLKVTDLKWISVWCRAFKVNFGDLTFPDNLVIDDHDDHDSDSEPESELPPPLLPPHNAHDPDHRHDDHHGDADAEGEAESEAESEPSSEAEAESEGNYGGSGNSIYGFNVLLAVALSVLVGKW